MRVRAAIRFIRIVEEAGEQEAKIRVFPEFCAGLKGIEDFSYLIVLYWLDSYDTEEKRRTLLVFLRRHRVNVEKGVLACRSPSRPNPIGLCVVELVKVEGCRLTVTGLDAFESSPIVDIKPYIPRADSIPNAHVPSWTENGPTT
jgi:tRNA-Thr(GGU) m(6)t(6)A37 methyltransferase TsaA